MNKIEKELMDILHQEQKEAITISKAGELLSKTKEEMKQFIEENGLTKLSYGEPVYRYVLYLDEVMKYKV